jgi:hypothetical protein
VALVAGCTAAPPPEIPGAAALRGFLIDIPLPPYEMRGAITAAIHGRTESGEVYLRSGPGDAHLFQLRARISGSLAVEARFDARQLLVLDFVNEAYFRGPNLPETRREQFLMDLSPEEFRIIVTGRLERSVFDARGGRWAAPSQASFEAGEDRYVFTLDESGLPREWVKFRGAAQQFRVEYRSYKDVALDAGAPVRMPERVRVYGEEEPPRIVLGVREFTLLDSVPPLGFDLPPDAAARFRRLPPP